MAYDPFAAGPFEVASRTIEAHDTTRDRRLPCDVWQQPAQPGTYRSSSTHTGAHQ